MQKLSTALLVCLLILSMGSLLFGQDIVRKEVDVPKVDPSTMMIDGVMDEVAWGSAAEANLVTATGFEIWYNPYGRIMDEPDYDEFYGRMLWSPDTLWLFIHIDEYVDDSTGLYFAEQWDGDQLFVGLSSRLGLDMEAWYDGNVYAAPEGPYHFLILGESITLNGDQTSQYIPEGWRYSFGDSLGSYSAADYTISATTIDTVNGVFDIEMAIYHPNIYAQSLIGFNIGGSNGSKQFSDDMWVADTARDAYAYYCWQPNIADDPLATAGSDDPGAHTLKTSKHWAILNFTSDGGTYIADEEMSNRPLAFSLRQNFPNPFNPMTTIRFNLAENAPVTLKVFDMLGKEVATLVNDRQFTSGTYSVSWNASDFSSGVYFYQLTAANMTITRKMVLMK